MKRSVCLVLALTALLGIALTACSEPSSDYYENDLHSGYPGPAPKSQKDG